MQTLLVLLMPSGVAAIMIMKVATIHTKVSLRPTCCSPGWTTILYTHRRCLEVAPFRHAAAVLRCPPLGVEQT